MSCSNVFIPVNKIHGVRRKLVLRNIEVFGRFEFEGEAEKEKLKFIQSNISSVDNVLLERKVSGDLEENRDYMGPKCIWDQMGPQQLSSNLSRVILV